MTFKRAIPRCTPEQQARQDRARELGCIACRMQKAAEIDKDIAGYMLSPTIHHLTKSGRTISQDATVCLCRWHHLGEVTGYITSSLAKIGFGPSLAKGSKPFHARYGDNAALLEYQNKLLKE